MCPVKRTDGKEQEESLYHQSPRHVPKGHRDANGNWLVGHNRVYGKEVIRIEQKAAATRCSPLA